MATAVIMPRQGQSVESCIIAKWHKKVGDTVAPGDILFSYETDKASFEEESKLSGTMLDIFFEEGDDVPCLTNVCVIGNPGESTAQFKPAGEEEEAPAASEDSAPAEETAQTAPAQTVSRSADEFIKISPRAKNLAARQGVDYTVAPATGPNGRIIERDIDAMIASGNAATFAARDGFVGSGSGIEGTGIGGRVRMADLNAPAVPAAAAVAEEGPEYVDVPMTNIRKVIAKNMIHSLSTIAQLTYNMHFDMTAVNAFRAAVKAGGEALNVGKITINDVILYAVSRVLKNHPDFNAHCVDNKVRQFTHVHLGVAVDTERGLMVPTIRNADCKSLSEIAKEAKELAAACQKGSIAPRPAFGRYLHGIQPGFSGHGKLHSRHQSAADRHSGRQHHRDQGPRGERRDQNLSGHEPFPNCRPSGDRRRACLPFLEGTGHGAGKLHRIAGEIRRQAL